MRQNTIENISMIRDSIKLSQIHLILQNHTKELKYYKKVIEYIKILGEKNCTCEIT